MKLRIPWAPALTFTRLLLVPGALLLAGWESWGAACLVYAAAALTDLFDGPLARAAGGGGRLGALLDLAADFTLVVPVAFFLSLRGILPPLLPVLASLSFIMYCANCLARRSFVRHKFGAYAGAASMIGIWAVLFLQWFRPAWQAAQTFVWTAMAACLALAMVESGMILAGVVKTCGTKREV